MNDGTLTPATIKERALKAFELPGELLDIEEQLWLLHEEHGPEAELPAELQERINRFCEQGPVAILKVHRAIVAIRREGETVKDMARALAERASAKERSAERLGEMLLKVLDTSFNGKVKLDGLTAWGQDTNTEVVEFESADPEEQAKALDALPSNLRRVKVELNKTEAKAALKAGNALPGLFLKKNTSRSIRFKV